MYFTYRQVEQINLPIKYLELMYHLNNLSVIFLRIETVFIWIIYFKYIPKYFNQYSNYENFLWERKKWTI